MGKDQFPLKYKKGSVQNLTFVLELDMCLSCPDLAEKESLRFPGPISMISFCGRSYEETTDLLTA